MLAAACRAAVAAVVDGTAGQNDGATLQDDKGRCMQVLESKGVNH